MDGINLLVAVAENGVIGGDNKLLWHLPADLKYFKGLTVNNVVVMGRKTYESIGRPLANRINIVISRNEGMKIEGCIVLNSLGKAIQYVESLNSLDKIVAKERRKVFVIGGAQIYKLALPLATNLYVTEVKAKFEGDTYFEPILDAEWIEISRETHVKDEKNKYNYDFVIYEKIKK